MRKFIQAKSIINYIAAFLAVFMLCFCTTCAVWAEPTAETKAEESGDITDKQADKDADRTDKDKDEGKVDPKQKPVLKSGETGILVDSASGRVLFESDAYKKMYPASTTKIMTALLAIEAIERGEFSMESSVTITSDMLANTDPDGSNMALKEGEVLTLENLLKGLMIPSGNDAACAIAAYISGSIPAFVDKMNARAAELGAADTHFKNPHGLHDDGHYTTAADMAKIACTAMKLDKFRNIADIAHVKIPPTNMTEKERYYINTNGLLSTMRYTNFHLKGSIGIKTGYTSNAGNCLVSAAARGGVELIGVVFGAKDVTDSHNDSRQMLEWGFANFVSTIALNKDDMPCEVKVKQGKGTDALPLSVPKAVSVLISTEENLSDIELIPHIPDSVYAPINSGDAIGEVSVMLNGMEIGKSPLVATRNIERSIFWPVMALGEWLWSITAIRIIVYMCGGIILAFIVLFFMALYRNIKKAKRHRRR